MYKYTIDQNPNPYINISRIIYTKRGYIAFTPKVTANDIKSNDTGSMFGSEDIANLKANIKAPNSPYKQISLVLIFILFT